MNRGDKHHNSPYWSCCILKVKDTQHLQRRAPILSFKGEYVKKKEKKKGGEAFLTDICNRHFFGLHFSRLFKRSVALKTKWKKTLI